MVDVFATKVPEGGWRIKLGIGIFCFSIALPVLGIPLVAALGLPAATVATVSGAMLVGAEILGLVAVAVMGKSGYAYIKSRIFGFLKKYGPPREVSRARYTIGIVMFGTPIIFGVLAPYTSDLIPGYLGNELTYSIIGDLVLLASLFVLGGDFWDKLRGVFIHEAKTTFPNKAD